MGIWKDIIMFISYYSLLSLAMLRVYTMRHWISRPAEAYMVVFYLFFALVYAVFVTRLRYRLPMDWLLICLAALQVETLLRARQWKGSTRRHMSIML